MSAAMLDIRAHRRAGASAPAETLEARDVLLLHALADDQLRFGQAEEALVLLRLCQYFDPANPDTILRLARVFAALEEWDAAEAMLDAHRRLARGAVRRAAEALLAAVVAQGRHRLGEARAAFADFLTLRAAEPLP